MVLLFLAFSIFCLLYCGYVFVFQVLFLGTFACERRNPSDDFAQRKWDSSTSPSVKRDGDQAIA